VVNAYRASEITYAPPTRATWDEIVSSGHIGLLPREAVESGMTNYYAVDTSQFIYNILQGSDYRRRVREIIPLEIQMAMRAGCSDIRDEAQQMRSGCGRCGVDQDRERASRRPAASRAPSVPVLERLHRARQSRRRRGAFGARARGAAR
jgi:hypothetical protein